MSPAFWTCGAVTATSAAVSFGYALSALAVAGQEARTASMYAFARSLALVGTAVAAPFTRSAGFVTAAAVAMIVVQAADAIVGGVTHNRLKTSGPAVTAVVNLVALLWMSL